MLLSRDLPGFESAILKIDQTEFDLHKFEASGGEALVYAATMRNGNAPVPMVVKVFKAPNAARDKRLQSLLRLGLP